MSGEENIAPNAGRFEEQAILVFRPYPPKDLPQVNSQLGGLPILPPDMAWPRASDGTPLHFLARIDCAELPATHSVLPNRGVLQFFARLNEEMDWDEPHSDFSRVLYHDGKAGQHASAPADLPSIQWASASFEKQMRLPNETKASHHPVWPLVFKTIGSRPYLPPKHCDEATRAEYWKTFGWAQAAEVVKATGRLDGVLSPDWGNYRFDRNGKSFITLPDRGNASKEFPEAWIIAERIARAMAHLASKKIQRLREDIENGQTLQSGEPPEQMLVMVERIAAQALAWVHRAEESGLDAAMDIAEAKEYREWLTQWGRDESSDIYYLVIQSLERGMKSAVNYCGGSREASAVVPTVYMNRLESAHSMITGNRFGVGTDAPRRHLSAVHHQMLGYASASQPVKKGARDILLLQLVSDDGVDFLFCDRGEIQFWIDAEDLAALRFDRVKANTQGG